MRHRWTATLLSAMLVVPMSAQAQDPDADSPAQQATGLPSGIAWTFNFDAGWGTFGFANSLFDNPKEPGVEENLSDQWFEGYAKPALSGRYTTSSWGVIHGKVSVVGERTYGSVPEAFGQDVSSFGPEDLYIGWTSGAVAASGDPVFDVSVGREQYRIGHGLLIFDGAAEGGNRGGYWTNARKAFELAAIGRFRAGAHTAEAFYLDKDELDENETGSRLWGANYEYRIGEETTLGSTYMRWRAHQDVEPGRDGLNVMNVRAYTAPIPAVPDLSFEIEYAAERNGVALEANAWTLQGAYALTAVPWQPVLSYRYAFFQGDDPATIANEAFDPLFLGFYDWGIWWQGEIAGEYFLSNSNSISHLARIQLTPREPIGAGLLFFKFLLDQPGSFGPGVIDRHVATELDAYVDWKINQNFTISVVGAYANPQKAVEEATGRTKGFTYGMVYVAYSY